jgi:hypothetical protein
MVPISVPFAPTPYKIVAGVPLLIFGALALYWWAKNLRLCIRMLQGKLPLPPGSSPPFVGVGVVLYLVALAVGVGATFFFVAPETTRPTIISQDGILVGAGPPRYQQRLIPWDEITKVTCNLPTEGELDSKHHDPLARFPGGTRECWTCLGRRSRGCDDKSPARHNSSVRTPRVRSFMVLLGGAT